MNHRRSPRRRAGAAALVLLAFVGLLVACGIPQDREPQKLARRLTQDTEPPQPADTTRTRAQTVYLVQTETGDPSSPESLVPVFVPVADPANPQDLPRVVLDQLLREPSQAEIDAGLITRIPRSTKITAVSPVDAGTVTVDVDGIDKVENAGQRLAFAQIVFTLTQLPQITGVRFLVNGNEVAVPLDEGTSDPGEAVNRSSFLQLSEALQQSGETPSSFGP